MRRLLTTLTTVALLIGLVAGPATADTPEEFTETEKFEDVNPCSGELITITIDAYLSVHMHDDTYVVRVKRTGTTSDGYIMEHGRDNFVADEMNFSGAFMDPWVNPDLGTKFVAQGRFVVVDDKVIIDDFRLECRS